MRAQTERGVIQDATHNCRNARKLRLGNGKALATLSLITSMHV